jgi:hypothetical protein
MPHDDLILGGGTRFGPALLTQKSWPWRTVVSCIDFGHAARTRSIRQLLALGVRVQSAMFALRFER